MAHDGFSFPIVGRMEKITPADGEVCAVACESEVQGSCQKKTQFVFKCHLQSVCNHHHRH